MVGFLTFALGLLVVFLLTLVGASLWLCWALTQKERRA